MIGKIKKFFEKIRVAFDMIQDIYRVVCKDEDAIVKWNRKVLMMIDPTDMKALDDMKQQERKNYVAEASNIYASDIFKNELKWLAKENSRFVVSQAQTWDQTILGRGNINGIGLVEERFQTLHAEHMDNIGKPEKVDEERFFPEV